MTASPDDAAASDAPLRAGIGPAAPSFPGTPGRRSPEDSPMAQHTPAPDETVRMRSDGPDGRPPLNGNRQARRDEGADLRGVVEKCGAVTRWVAGTRDDRLGRRPGRLFG